MNRKIVFVVSALAGFVSSTAAWGQAVPLKGNYISSAVGTGGTLGTGGSNSPGLIHDPSGTGNFDPLNDYITPGSPHQGFAITSDQSGFRENDNALEGGSFGSQTPTLLTGAAAMGFANAISWTGANEWLSVTNNYFLNPGDQRITISTTLKALQDLTGLAFVTSVDPDPDVGKFGVYDTNNQRGNSIYGVDDFVGSAGANSGLTLGLLNLNANGLAHSTQVNFDCCDTPNPFDVINHTSGDAGISGFGDYGLNLAYNIGSLAAGNTASFTYAYAVGDALETTGGVISTVPETATWGMMLIGFAAMGAAVRHRRKSTNVAFA